MDLTLINRHWEKGFSYPFPQKRQLYSSLVKALDRKFITSLVGLRRTGKTTLLKQLINHLININVPRENILFYSFDQSAELSLVVNEYLKISPKPLGQEKLYFFLDEVQKLPDWQNKIKIYYDHYPNIKFIVSGSSSIFLRHSSESLAGRVEEFWLGPLSFTEFLDFKKKSDLLEKPQLFSSAFSIELELFAQRQFIEIINADKESSEQYLDTLVRKIIFEDIPQVFSLEQPQLLFKIFRIIAANPGMLLDYRNLSSDLGMNEKTLSNYIYYLERAFLIRRLYNYSTNQLTSEKKLKKVYPLSSSFCHAEMPKVIESLVATQSTAQFFWRKKYEVDCIILKNNKVIPIEVKYQDSVKEKELKGLQIFMEEFKVERGMVLTKSQEKKDKKIVFIPVWKWLLEKDQNLP